MQKTVNNKVYPKTSSDARGIKFFFDFEDKHFTIRFSGNPILTLEYLFIKRWWRDFNKVYSDAKLWIQNESTKLLEECGKSVIEMQEVFFLMDMHKKSPFVVYVNDYDEYK